MTMRPLYFVRSRRWARAHVFSDRIRMRVLIQLEARAWAPIKRMIGRRFP